MTWWSGRSMADGKSARRQRSALMEDGSPVLILDVEDLMRSVATELQGGGCDSDTWPSRRQARRILVVDDSITVREVERSLLKTAATRSTSPWTAWTAGTHSVPGTTT